MKESDKLISIIIPVYNAEKYLRRCLNSILAQTYKNWEAILVDDGSSDNSGAICDEYATKDKRFKVIHQRNRGVSSARNRGIEQVQGIWIAFIDADDYVGTDYINGLYERIKEEHDFIIQGYNKVINTNTIDKISLPDNVYYTNDFYQLFSKIRIYEMGFPWAKLYNSNIIKRNYIRFDRKISCCEDLIFMFEYLVYCNSIQFIPKTDYYYMTNDSTLSRGYYSFESEYYLFSTYKKLIESIAKNFKFDIPKEALLFGGTLLMRAILSTYKGKHLSRNERISNLEKVEKENKHYLQKYYEPGSFLLKMMKYLFISNIRLFDFICIYKFG